MRVDKERYKALTSVRSHKVTFEVSRLGIARRLRDDFFVDTRKSRLS